MNNKKILIILAIIIGLGPLSIDMYLPAFPAIKLYFLANISQVQLTMSSYLLGFAVFHLICGPLSDRYGRRPILIYGLFSYVLSSALCVFSKNIEQLIFFRFLQGMSVCVAPVLCRAIVRDTFSALDVVKALATVSAIMAVAPIAAPIIGSMLLGLGDWRWIFGFLTVSGGIAMLLAVITIKETLPEKQPFTLKNIQLNLFRLTSDRIYMGSVLVASFLYAPLFAFLSSAGFVLIDFYGVPTGLFGAYFVFIVIGFMLGNYCIAKIFSHWSWQFCFILGIGIGFLAVFALFIGMAVWHHPFVIILPMLMLTFSIGIISPKATGLALENYAHMAATASALMGFLQMLMASLSGFIVGLLLEDNPKPVAIVILCCIFLGAVSYFFLLRGYKQKQVAVS